MIAYDLICSNGHKFECWFKDRASYEEQKSAGIINCPFCNDMDVERVFSPFAIVKNEKVAESRKENNETQNSDLQQVLRRVQEYIDQHFEEVGHEFTKQALKIHYGMSEERNIKGLATPDQEKLLKEEGVKFFKVPILKRLDS
jgi:hypothetical protein